MNIFVCRAGPNQDRRCGARFPAAAHVVPLKILGQRVRLECPAPALRDLLIANFDAMISPVDGPWDLGYLITFDPDQAGIVARARDAGELLYALEKHITVELQIRRPELFFLHAAALGFKGKAWLLAAESGSGKSTTTWALLHHKLAYLTDELSAVELDSLRVWPYPHALCLKREPPVAYPLPSTALRLERTIHVPAQFLPGPVVDKAMPIGGVVLLAYQGDLDAPALRELSVAEASARLYVTALNALAHPNNGMDAAVHMAERLPCFSVVSGELRATCGLILSLVTVSGRVGHERGVRYLDGRFQ